jgi:YD repeat-containing protein
MVSVVTGSGLGLDQTSGFVLGSRGQLGGSAFGRYGEAVTVNAATGNLFISRTDEILLGLGTDAVVSRSYNSLAQGTDDNGDNWQLGRQRKVAGLTGTVGTAGSTVTRYDWDGSSTLFTWDASKSAYVSGKVGHQDDRLTFSSNVWTWTDSGTRTSETYDHLNGGRLTAVRDADGNATNYSYTGSLLTRISTASGEFTDLTWSGNNLTQVVTTKSGGATLTRVRYTYDASNRLSTVSTDLSPDDNTIGDGKAVTTTYTYDGTSDRVASITQTGGAKLEFTYTLVLSVYRVATYKQTLADGQTSQVSLSYNTGASTTTVTDQSGQSSRFFYDSQNRLTGIELPEQAGNLPLTQTFTYDAAGNVLTAKDRSNAVTTYQYDANGNLTRIRDAAGNTLVYTYGTANQMLTETRYTVADPDGSASLSPSGPFTTRYVYDAEYHLRYVISPEGHVTQSDYNANGTLASSYAYSAQVYDTSGLTASQAPAEATMNSWVAAITDKSGRSRTDYTYDFRANLATSTSWSGATSAGAGSGTATTVTYVYDQFGSLKTRQTSGTANTEVFAYDGLGRMTSSVDLNGGSTTMAFTDSENRQTVTLASGLVQTSVYNYAGQLISYQTSGSGTATATTTYKYDALGRQRIAIDVFGNKSYAVYDTLGRKVADIAADGAITEYGYDGSDRLIASVAYATKLSVPALASLTDGNGNPTNVSVTSLRPAQSAGDVWEWRVYDAAGRPVQTMDGAGTTTSFEYDGASRLIRTTQASTALSATALANLKRTTLVDTNRVVNGPLASTANWSVENPSSLATSFYSGNWNATNLLKLEFNATGAGQTVSILSDAMPVTAFERYAVQVGVEGYSSSGTSVKVEVVWYGANGSWIGPGTIATSNPNPPYDSKLSGYMIAPWGAVTARLKITATSSAAGASSLAITEPVVARAQEWPGEVNRIANSDFSTTQNWTVSSSGLTPAVPSVAVWQDKTHLATIVAATAGGQSVAVTSDAFSVAAGERLAVQVGVEGGDVVNAASATVQWFNSSGTLLSTTALGSVSNPGFGSIVSGFVTAPTGAVTARLKVEGTTSGAGTGYLLVREPMVSLASETQTTMPFFTARPPSTSQDAVTRSVYDTDGNLVATVDGLGYLTQIIYDAAGRAVHTIAYKTAVASTTTRRSGTLAQLVSAVGTNAADIHTYSIYYNDGKLRYALDANLRPTEYVYDTAGNLTHTFDYGASIASSSSYTGDYVSGQISSLNLASNPATRKSWAVYDGAGRLAYAINAEGGVTGYIYDTSGRVTKTVQFLNARATTSDPSVATMNAWATSNAGAGDRTTRTYYDGLSHKIAQVDAAGTLTSWSYDANGQVIATETSPANRLGYSQFEGGTSGWALLTNNPSGLVVNGAPYTGVYQEKAFIKADVNATNPDQVASIGLSSANRFAVQVGERLSVQVGVEAIGSVRDIAVLVWWIDASGAITGNGFVGNNYTANLGTNPGFNSKIKGFVDVPAGAVKAYVEVYGYTSGSGQGALSVTEPIVSSATASQTSHIDFVPGSTTGSWQDSKSITTFGYDALGRLSTTTDALGTVTRLSYDAQDRVTDRTVAWGTSDASTNHYTYDAAGRVTDETAGWGTPDAATTHYTYDAFGSVLTRTSAWGTSDATTTAYTYDIRGQVLTQVAASGTSDAATTTFTYDAFGNVTSAKDPRNNLSYSAYDKLNRLIWQVDAEGYVTQTTYTIGDEVASVKRYAARSTASGAGVIPTVAATAGEDATTTFTRDKLGRVTRATDAMGAYEEYTLDALGNRLTVRNKLGGLTTNTFDKRGLLLSATTAISWKNAAGNDQFATVTTTYAYDSRGNRTQMVEASGSAEQRVTTYAYDHLDRLVSTTGMAVGVANDASLSQAGSYRRVDTIAYDRRGNVIETKVRQLDTANGTYSDDSRTRFYYDALDRKIAEIDPVGMLSTWTYDRNGNAILAETSAANRIGYSQFESGTNGWRVTWDPNSIVASGSPYIGTYQGKTLFKAEANAATSGQTFSLGSANDSKFAVQGGERISLQIGVEGQGVISSISAVIWWIAADGSTIGSSSAGDQLGNPGFNTKIRGFVTAPANAVRGFVEVYGTSSGAGWGAISITEPTVSSATANQTQPIDFVAGPTTGSVQEAKRSTSFTYDKLGRLLTSTVAAGQTGIWNGANYQVNVAGGVTVTNLYDKSGNITRQTDANGNSIYFYYDKLGRKVAQVDQENYLTTYALDADGNVAKEIRYSTKLSGTLAVGTTPGLPAANDNDRTTEFTYDSNGRRLTEERLGVTAWTINTETGALASANGRSIVRYAYNALGEVTRKTEATTDYTDYFYDSAGRQTRVLSSQFKDYNTTDVQRQTEMGYNGLGNLVWTTERGVLVSNNDATSGDSQRTTFYYYDGAGRLSELKDAAGISHYYEYDIADRLIRDLYQRSNSAGANTAWEANETRYDAGGRVTKQAVRIWNGSTWLATSGNIDTEVETRITYNIYGEMIGKGLAATSAGSTILQEKYDYDSSGRIWRSNAGDGVVKLYLYDKNGNQTATISSDGGTLPSGYNWSTLTIQQAVSLLTDGGTLGNVTVSGMVVTLQVYDKRGQLTQTREAQRQVVGSNGAVTTQTLVNQRIYNAFGEVTKETDARGGETDYAYNTIGKVIQRQSPTVSWTSENGAQANNRPTENYYYDASGRLLGVQDANGNRNTKSLLSGTGYGDEEALTLTEFHADSGKFQKKYNAFNDLRGTTDEVGKTEAYYYDNRGLLVEQDHQTRSDWTQLRDYYGYDALGQRIWHYNSQLGSGVKETTDYDALGRVVSVVEMGGDMTNHAYVWDSSWATSGVGVFGGWNHYVVNAANKSNVVVEDYFGRALTEWDFGGHNYNYTYDAAGRLGEKTNNAGLDTKYTYYNTGLISSIITSTNNGYDISTATSTFRYDAVGNRTFESHAVTGSYYDYDEGTSTSYTVSYQNASATYDLMNRVTSISDTGSAAPITIAYEYDLVGNIRHMASSFRYMDQQGAISGTAANQDYWYKYDSMNRFVATQGALIGTRGSGSIAGRVAITYDLAGRRAQVISAESAMISVANPDYHGSPYDDPSEGYIPYYYDKLTRETYTYTSDGYLESVNIVKNDAYDNGDGTATVNPLPASGVIRARYVRDLMGRVTDYSEYGEAGYATSNEGTNRVYRRQTTYDAKSHVTQDVATSLISGETWVNTSSYFYNASETSTGEWTGVASGGSYMGGVVTRIATTVTKNGSTQTGNTSTNSYKWWSGAVQSKMNYVSGSTNNTSTFYLDNAGVLNSVYVQDGRPRSITFINNASGMVMSRDENDNKSTGDPRELHYYFNGVGIGDVSNNGTSDVDYVASIAEHTARSGTGPYRNGSTYGNSYADFDQSYDPINGLNYEGAASRYTVQSGDTLDSIALQLWGDASYWYLIADANGLSGSGTLVSGQSLIIPNKVHNSHNNADTYRVYDPNEAIGDTSPTAAKPPKKAKCGAFGQILLVAIAVAVTIIASPAALSTVSFGQGLLAGAAGSLASQAVGIATGIQNKFDFKGLALSALAGGVTAGIGPGGKMLGLRGANGMFGSGWAAAAGRGLVSSAITQGVGVATGLQRKFNWGSIATAGVGAGVGNFAGGSGFGKFGSSMAGGIAGAAAASLVTGQNFGDTLASALPSIIGNTIGNLAADGIASIGRPKSGTMMGAGWADDGDGFMINQGAIDRASQSVLGASYGGSLVNTQEAQSREAMARYIISVEKGHGDVPQSSGSGASIAASPASFYDNVTYAGGSLAGSTRDNVGVAAYYQQALDYDPLSGTIGVNNLTPNADGSNTTSWAVDYALTKQLQQGYSELNWGLGGFLAAGIAGGATAAAGAGIIAAYGLSGGAALGVEGLSAGFAGANSGSILRYSSGDSVTAGTYGTDFLIGTALWGAGRGTSAIWSRAGLGAAPAATGIGNADDFGIPKFLNPRQDLHIPPVTDGRSVLTVDPSDLLQRLHSGDFTILRAPKPGQVVVDFRQPIGEYWSNGTRVGETQFGSVSYGKKGAHIIPANPNQW